jgi:Mg2+ and Co2+ transporter CorA
VLTDGDGKETRIRKKATLQELLERAIRDDEEIIKVESKTADPRKLILDTAQTLNKQLETLAKIAGVVQEVTNVDVNVSVNTVLASTIVQVIQREVEDPEVVKRIVEGISHDA